MKYKYLLLLLFSLLFFSCEMKKEILGQTDKGQTDDTTVENQGLLDLELKPEKEADIRREEVLLVHRLLYWMLMSLLSISLMSMVIRSSIMTVMPI